MQRKLPVIGVVLAASTFSLCGLASAAPSVEGSAPALAKRPASGLVQLAQESARCINGYRYIQQDVGSHWGSTSGQSIPVRCDDGEDEEEQAAQPQPRMAPAPAPAPTPVRQAAPAAPQSGGQAGGQSGGQAGGPAGGQGGGNGGGQGGGNGGWGG